jgi:hypothetical protein
MTCEQCAGIARLCQAFIAESIIAMYPRYALPLHACDPHSLSWSSALLLARSITDKQNLQTVVFKELRFQEDKDEVSESFARPLHARRASSRSGGLCARFMLVCAAAGAPHFCLCLLTGAQQMRSQKMMINSLFICSCFCVEYFRVQFFPAFDRMTEKASPFT